MKDTHYRPRFTRDAGWCFIEDHTHAPPAPRWWVSINGGCDPMPWQRLGYRTATEAKTWLARLYMGNCGRVGVA